MKTAAVPEQKSIPAEKISTSKKETKDANASKKGTNMIYGALDSVHELIKDFKIAWNPVSGSPSSDLWNDALEKRYGHRVVQSAYSDYYVTKNRKRYDILLAMVPYDHRVNFILRAIELKKTFALLVPINVLENGNVRGVLRDYNISMVFLPGKTQSMWLLRGVDHVPPVVFQ
jgi:hypothetical protein